MIKPFAEVQIVGGPVPQPRPRATIRGGHASVYEAAADHKIHNWKAHLMLAAQNAMAGRVCVEHAVRVEALFKMWRAKNVKAGPHELVPHDRRPDLDNLVKAFDALNTILWRDDSQVSTLVLRKRWCMEGEQPGVDLRAYEDRIPWPSALCPCCGWMPGATCPCCGWMPGARAPAGAATPGSP